MTHRPIPPTQETTPSIVAQTWRKSKRLPAVKPMGLVKFSEVISICVKKGSTGPIRCVASFHPRPKSIFVQRGGRVDPFIDAGLDTEPIA